MGLDISHDTWHGAYSAFMRWRQEIARIAGYPPLDLMEGFYDGASHNPLTLLEYKYPKGDELDMASLRRIFKQMPIKWDNFKNDPLIHLLTHSDCDGYISYGIAEKIANRLEELLPLCEGLDLGGHIGDLKEKTKTFINGLRDAHSKKERVQFR